MVNETYVSNPTQYFDYSPPVLFLWGRWHGNSIAERDEIRINFNPMSDAASFQVEVYYKKNGAYVTELHSLPTGGGDLVINCTSSEYCGHDV